MAKTKRDDKVARIEKMEDIENHAVEDIQKHAHRQDDPEWTTAQKRYLRKLDLIILPMISLLYFFEYLDRGNVAVSTDYGRIQETS